MTLKKNHIIAVLAILFVVLVGFSGKTYINLNKEKRTLKNDLKQFEKINDSLQNVIDNSYNYIEDESQEKYNYYYDFKKEQKLRKSYEKELNIYRNYNKRFIDSVLSNYRFIND